MRVCENGIMRDATPKEIALLQSVEILPYKERIVNRIREKYSLDDELAILRQRDTKTDEFLEYNEYVEKIKREEREK